eukprot:3109074-Ditylum_brightwellii.AAC.1
MPDPIAGGAPNDACEQSDEHYITTTPLSNDRPTTDITPVGNMADMSDIKHTVLITLQQALVQVCCEPSLLCISLAARVTCSVTAKIVTPTQLFQLCLHFLSCT